MIFSEQNVQKTVENKKKGSPNKQTESSIWEREKEFGFVSVESQNEQRKKKNKIENNIGLSHFIATECICCFIYDNLLIKQNINGEISIVWLPGILLKPDTIENH